jgi:hypothetical protein
MTLVLALPLTAGCNDGGEDKAARTTTQRAQAAPTPVTGAPASPADERAIRALLTRLFKSGTVSDTCERSLTTRLFRRIYTGPAACRKAETEDDKNEDKPTKTVVVSDVRTSGGRASARARLVGGDTAGAMGTMTLSKEKAGWRLDDMATPFLRSVLKASLKTDEDIPKPVRRCVDARFTRMSDQELKPFAYGLFGHRTEATAKLYTQLLDCDPRKGGTSLIRKPLEREIRKQLGKAGAKRRQVDCVLRRMRTTLPDKLLIQLSAKDDRPSKQRITRAVVAAAVACGAGGRRDPGQLTPV